MVAGQLLQDLLVLLGHILLLVYEVFAPLDLLLLLLQLLLQ